MKRKSALVIFGGTLPPGGLLGRHYDVVLAVQGLQQAVEAAGLQWHSLEALTGPGSVYEASDMLEALSHLKLDDGSRVSKALMYKGYELWWTHYDSLFYHFCLPYTQYKKLLEFLKDFSHVETYRLPHKALFYYHLRAYGSTMGVVREPGIKSPSALPFGVVLQMLITLLSLPVLAMRRPRAMLFIGDKFGQSKDHDFRMEFVYQELRRRGVPFVECIRSLESWKVIVHHAFVRRRAVAYSEAVAFMGRFLSGVSGARRRARREFGEHRFGSVAEPEQRFKLLVATRYLSAAYDDIWAIRIMRWLLRAAGVRAAFIPAATERNFHTVLGCKLNAIPTVGIMHGVPSRYSTPYDFMMGFDGEKMLSVDTYGVWSEWWRAQYLKNSQAYRQGQLHVSGPMRPLEAQREATASAPQSEPVRVLFIAEQGAAPAEVMPYLCGLLEQNTVELTLKFRPYRDEFEQWLLQNRPDILKLPRLAVVRGGMQEAIQNADVMVGCYSTGVLEGLLQLKVPVFIRTKKWGDYYDLAAYDTERSFFAENPAELIKKILDARSVRVESLKDLRERYFGDPHKNGSAWAVDTLVKYL